MKKTKIVVTTITISIVVGGLLAFKVNRENGKTFLCQNTEGTCVYNTKYKMAVPPWSGQLMYCNDGSYSTICNNPMKVVVATD